MSPRKGGWEGVRDMFGRVGCSMGGVLRALADDLREGHIVVKIKGAWWRR